MKYKHYTPQEIAAFLEPHRAALVDAIQKAAGRLGCTCYPEYIRMLKKRVIVDAEARKLYAYILDLAKNTPADEKAAKNQLFRIGGKMAFFLSAPDPAARRKTAARNLSLPHGVFSVLPLR